MSSSSYLLCFLPTSLRLDQIIYVSLFNIGFVLNGHVPPSLLTPPSFSKCYVGKYFPSLLIYIVPPICRMVLCEKAICHWLAVGAMSLSIKMIHKYTIKWRYSNLQYVSIQVNTHFFPICNIMRGYKFCTVYCWMACMWP